MAGTRRATCAAAAAAAAGGCCSRYFGRTLTGRATRHYLQQQLLLLQLQTHHLKQAWLHSQGQTPEPQWPLQA
jgi:hypothetical protein